MSWKHLLATRKVHTHQSSKQELDDLRAVIRRDLADATIAALSEDRRFATAYNFEVTSRKSATLSTTPEYNRYLNRGRRGSAKSAAVQGASRGMDQNEAPAVGIRNRAQPSARKLSNSAAFRNSISAA
jgi:hypothetical protein